MKNSVQASAGIEFDTRSLRAVKLTPQKGRDSSWQMEQCEFRGDFSKESELVDALKKAVVHLGLKKIPTATSLWGKQAYITELSLKKGTLLEHKTAVQFELRKSVPFDVTSAIIDFHEIGEQNPESDMATFAIGAISQQLFRHHIRVLESAEIKPEIVDLLPFSICTASSDLFRSPEIEGASLILHVGSEVSTLIINDFKSAGTLYHRSIYFSSDEIFVQSELSEEEVSRRLMALVEEVNRTVQFYKKNFPIDIEQKLLICGIHSDQQLLKETLQHTDLALQTLTIPAGVQTSFDESAQQAFSLACSLALQVQEGGLHE